MFLTKRQMFSPEELTEEGENVKIKHIFCKGAT